MFGGSGKLLVGKKVFKEAGSSGTYVFLNMGNLDFRAS